MIKYRVVEEGSGAGGGGRREDTQAIATIHTTDKQATPPSCLLSPHAFILPHSRTLPPSTGVMAVGGGSVRE